MTGARARVFVVLSDPEGEPTSVAPAEVVSIGRASADVLVYDVVPRSVPLSACFLEERGASAALADARRAYTTECIAALAASVAHA